MKRVSALICLMIMAVSILAPSCFAAKETANTQKGANFNIEKTTPENNAKNVSVENLSVKIYFDTEMLPKDKASREANAKQFKLTDKKGKKIPIKVYYSHKEEGLVMVVSDTVKKDIQIEGDTEYDLTIGKNLTSTDGTKMGVSHKLHFKTLDQKGSTRIYMIMMVVMIVGMIFFSSRSAKKAMEKEKEEKGKSETVNPYKEAKRTGKSVEEIVEKDKKRKAKQAEAEEKRRAEARRKAEERQRRFAEERRKAEEKRRAEARRKAEEERLVAEKRRAETERFIEANRDVLAQCRRLAEEKAKAEQSFFSKVHRSLANAKRNAEAGGLPEKKRLSEAEAVCKAEEKRLADMTRDVEIQRRILAEAEAKCKAEENRLAEMTRDVEIQRLRLSEAEKLRRQLSETYRYAKENGIAAGDIIFECRSTHDRQLVMFQYSEETARAFERFVVALSKGNIGEGIKASKHLSELLKRLSPVHAAAFSNRLAIQNVKPGHYVVLVIEPSTTRAWWREIKKSDGQGLQYRF